MAQHDYVIANGTGAAVRSDLNNGLSAIVTQNSGATEPATTYAFMRWADTTAGVMKMRNSANNAWITLYQLDGEWTNIAFENGTAAAPSIYFKDSGTDTGFYSPGANQVGISTGGTARLTIDSNGNVDIDSNTLYVDATNNRVGLGSSSPASKLTVAGTQGNYRVDPESVSNEIQILATVPDNSGFRNYRVRSNQIFLETSGSTALTIDTSQRVGIGTTTPGSRLAVNGDLAVGVDTALGTTANRNVITVNGTNDSLITFGVGGTRKGSIYHGGTNMLVGNDANGSLAFHTNNTERAQIDSSGRLLVGTSSAPTGSGSSQYAKLNVTGNSQSSATAGILSICRGEAPTSITADETLGAIVFGDTGAGEYAQITCAADANAGTNDYPGRLVFSTTADGASSPTERMRICNNGTFRFTTSGNYTSTTSNYNEIYQTNTAVALYARNTSGTPYGYQIYHDTAANNTGSEFFYASDVNAQRCAIRSNGGIANYQANNVNLCDEREKKNIVNLDSTWDCLKHWELKKFHYNEDADTDDLRYGVIAQQVADYCPEVISEWVKQKAEPAKLDEEGNEIEPAKEEILRMAVKEQQMMWMAIKALQEAQLRIEALEAEVAALKGA